jgi:hypothetical protein
VVTDDFEMAENAGYSSCQEIDTATRSVPDRPALSTEVEGLRAAYENLRQTNATLSETIALQAVENERLREAQCSHRTLAEWDELSRKLFLEREVVAALSEEIKRLREELEHVEMNA